MLSGFQLITLLLQPSQLLYQATNQLKPIYPSATAMVEAGGLASVVVDQHDLGVATGKMIAQVLKGAKPADTPVNVFSTGKSVINKNWHKNLVLLFLNLF